MNSNFINLNNVFKDIKIIPQNWSIHDVRIDIPSQGSGSDGINPHTQYSNPLIYANIDGIQCSSISFTLGKGNDIVVQCIKNIIHLFEGLDIYEVLNSPKGIYYLFSEIDQLRWLSPYSGSVYMASAAILNLFLDFAAKKNELPLWKLLSMASSEHLLQWIDTRNFSNNLDRERIFNEINYSFSEIDFKIKEIEKKGIPVYFTTWIGDTNKSLLDQILQISEKKGISNFKIKLKEDNLWNYERICFLNDNLPPDLNLAADTNQTLGKKNALELLSFLNNYKYLWLEEPFAPDNVSMHKDLYSRIDEFDLLTKIATGENCPNAHTALDFIYGKGCHIFQIDACRVMSLCDYIPILVGAKCNHLSVIPHAGGSGLDELVPHLQAFNLCRINPEFQIESSLMENVGFCSELLSNPTIVNNGIVKAPQFSGYFGGTFKDIPFDTSPTNSITWLKL